jgi:Exopolyphosphatase
MRTIGVVDIGSNSMSLIIVEINKNSSFRIIDELKESVRLGMDMSENGDLSEFRIEKAVQALIHFKNLSTSLGANELIAVATEAVERHQTRMSSILNIENYLEEELTIILNKYIIYLKYYGFLLIWLHS